MLNSVVARTNERVEMSCASEKASELRSAFDSVCGEWGGSGERGSKIDRSGRFPHPAFLVGDCDDFSHSDSLCPTLVPIGEETAMWGKAAKKKS